MGSEREMPITRLSSSTAFKKAIRGTKHLFLYGSILWSFIIRGGGGGGGERKLFEKTFCWLTI